MNKQQAMSLLQLIADLYVIINTSEPVNEVATSEVVFPHAVKDDK